MTELDTIKKNPLLLLFVDEQTLENCMTAVQQNGYAIQFVKDKTSEIYLSAVENWGSALKYVKEQTLEICLAAVKNWGCALCYVKEQTPEICMAAVQQNPEAKKYIRIKLPYYINSTQLEDDVCPICLDDKSDDNNWCMLFNCKHKYHFKCIDSWISKQTVENEKTCPKCRIYIY